jgi:formyl-CoA transferase
VAAVETVAAELILNAPTYAFMGAVQSRRPGSKDPFTGEPIAVKDGYAAVQTNAWTTLAMFAELLDEPRLAEERFDNQAKRIANAQDLTQIVTDALGRVTGRELLERASAAGMLAGFAQTAAQLLDCPQLVERGAFVELEADAGALGPWRMPVLLSRMSRTPATVRHRAPALGEHNGRVWLDEGPPRASSPAPASPRTSPSRPARPAGRPGPLAGLRVVDLSSVVAAPLVGGMLCDLGADVIKVEAPARLDQGRGPVFGPLFNNEPGDEPWNRSGSFQSLNRGKRSISLDLKHERGREILRQLIASADILLENFTPRVMRGWGLTYESLAAQNPGLIMFSNTGYGSTGPWSSFKAQGTSLEVTMGVGTYSGYPGEKPTKIGQSYPDFIAAWAGLTAVMAALVSRRETGLGQWIDCGMYELGTAMIPEAFIAVQAGRPDYERRGNEDLGGLFSGVFRAAGEDRWVAVSIPDEKTWAALRAVVPGLPDTPPGDSDRDAAAAALRQWLAPRDALAAATRLQGCGVPAAPVNNARDLLFDPHLFARGMYEDCDYGDDVGVVPILSRGFRWNASRAHVGVRGPGPRFAAHNDEVLGELGVAPGERERLRREGILVDRPIKLPVLAPADVAANLRNHIYSEVDHDYRQRIRTGRARLVVEPTDRVD